MVGKSQALKIFSRGSASADDQDKTMHRHSIYKKLASLLGMEMAQASSPSPLRLNVLPAIAKAFKPLL